MPRKQAIFFHQGDYHFKLRRLVLRAFTPESIKHMVSHIESITIDALQSWENRLINTFQEMKTVSEKFSKQGIEKCQTTIRHQRTLCFLTEFTFSSPVYIQRRIAFNSGKR